MEIIEEGQLILKYLWDYPKIDLFRALLHRNDKRQNLHKSFPINFLQSFLTLSTPIILQKQHCSKLWLSCQNASPKFLNLTLNIRDDLKLLFCWQFIDHEY